MLARRPSLIAFCREERGAAAVEFVLIMIPLIMLTIGVMNLCLMLYTVATLNYTAQDAARCASVRTICNSDAAITTYARTRYQGPARPTVVFTRTLASCGNRIVATASYKFTTGLTSSTIPLTAVACYPTA